MKRILYDYMRMHLQQLIGYVIVTAAVIAGLIFSGMYHPEKMWWAAIVVTVFIAAVTLWTVLDVLVISPMRFRKEVNGLPEKERDQLLTEYPKAKCDNGHRYMNSYLLFYRNHRIYAVRYSDITEIEGGTKNLFLTVNGYSKTLVLPFDLAGPNAVALAFLCNKNPEIKLLCDRTVKDAD